MIPSWFLRTGLGNPVSADKEVYEAFEKIKYKTKMPLVAYSIPFRTKGRAIQPRTMGRLAHDGLIEGFKDSSGNIKLFNQYAKSCDGTEVKAYVGDTITGLYAGNAYGIVSGEANIIPKRMAKLGILQLNLECESSAIDAQRIVEIKKLYFGKPVAVFKKVLNLKGICDKQVAFAEGSEDLTVKEEVKIEKAYSDGLFLDYREKVKKH